MASRFFSTFTSRPPGIAKEILQLQAASNYTPAQVSGDTYKKPCKKTLPTLGKLLTVHKGEKFRLPDNEVIQWVLVERELGINETSNDDCIPLWGFIPSKCLSFESLSLIHCKSDQVIFG